MKGVPEVYDSVQPMNYGDTTATLVGLRLIGPIAGASTEGQGFEPGGAHRVDHRDEKGNILLALVSSKRPPPRLHHSRRARRRGPQEGGWGTGRQEVPPVNPTGRARQRRGTRDCQGPGGDAPGIRRRGTFHPRRSSHHATRARGERQQSGEHWTAQALEAAPLSIMQKRLVLSFVAPAAAAVLSRSALIEPPVNLV
jgi:hypothetical protein